MADFRVAKRRSDWRLGRWTAKLAVAAHLGASNLADIEIRAAPSGAPEAFYHGGLADVSISISHRGGVAACVTSPPGVALGCDLEIVEPRIDAFTTDYFTEEEQAGVARSSDRFRTLALLWSAKESALKALRTGLTVDTRSVKVKLEGLSSQRWQPMTIECAGGPGLFGRWDSEREWVRTVAADCAIEVAPGAVRAAMPRLVDKRRGGTPGLYQSMHHK